MTSPVMPVHWG